MTCCIFQSSCVMFAVLYACCLVSFAFCSCSLMQVPIAFCIMLCLQFFSDTGSLILPYNLLESIDMVPLFKWAFGLMSLLCCQNLHKLSTFCAWQSPSSKHTRQYTSKRQASESEDMAEDASNKKTYDTPLLIVQADATFRRTDRWAAMYYSVGSCRWRSQIARWLSIHLHKLDMRVCLGQLSTMASVALYC